MNENISADDIRRLNILVLDKDQLDVKFLALQLNRSNLFKTELKSAESLDDALAILSSNHVEVVLVNSELEGMSGLEAIRGIRSEGFSLPMILLWTRAGDEDEADFFQAGAADYLIKDEVTPGSLERRILNAVDKYNLRERLKRKSENLEQANRDLRARNREVHSLYRSLATELSGPVEQVRDLLATGLELAGSELPPKARDLFTEARNICVQVDSCLEDMIDVVRLESGSMELSLVTGMVGEPVELAVSCLDDKAVEKEIQLHWEVEESLPPVRFDMSRLHQVVSVLVDNALDNTPAGGTVGVKVHGDPVNMDFIRISVKDDGWGMAKNKLEDVFDRRFSKVEGDGLGLSLSLCHGIVILHGGTIWAESEIGQGTTFNFTLPFAGAPEKNNNLATVPV